MLSVRAQHSRLLFAALCPFLALASCSRTELVGAQFVSAPITGAAAGETYNYNVISAGVIPASKVYTLLTSPAGMTVDNSGLVAWSPTFADLGETSVSLQVTDGDHTAVQDWTLTVHQDLLLGVGYSPRRHTSSTDAQDILDFAAEFADFGKLVGYSGSWRDSLSGAGTIPAFATSAMTDAASHGFVPVIGFSWADENGLADLASDGDTMDNTWSNQETRDEFLMTVEGFALLHRPAYLSLGYEVNTWSLANPGEFADWLTELEAVTAAVKAVSPETFVFTVFQYEHMAGLGANQGWSDMPQWNLIDDLDAAGFLDGIGFTSYPHFEYDDPANVPATHYDEITNHWSDKILFPELGWPTVVDGLFPGSEAQQNTSVTDFFLRIEGLPVELAQWLYLHDFDDQINTPGFMGIGFRSNDGNVIRPAEATWKTSVIARQRP